MPAEIGPTLETARLILRPPAQEDFDGFAAFASDEETMRFLGGTSPRDGAWRGMATLTGSWALLGYGMFSVIEKESGRWVGRLGPWRPGGEQGSWPGNEVGWGVLRAEAGKGYAYEGAVAAMDWAFDHLGWDEIIHCIDAENVRSIALAKRLGSEVRRKDVTLPAPYEANRVDIYAQTRQEWRSKPRS